MDIEVFTLFVEIPIFFQMRRNQCVWKFKIRTIAMDFWASLEHEIHYKSFQIQMWKP